MLLVRDVWLSALWCLLGTQSHGMDKLLVLIIWYYCKKKKKTMEWHWCFSNPCREKKLVECAKSLKVNSGLVPDADLGPVISKQVNAWIKSDSLMDWNSGSCKSCCSFISFCWFTEENLFLCSHDIFHWMCEIHLFSQAKERICKLIQSGVDDGARLLLDGRDIVVTCYNYTPAG